jgi:hypothetical protein
MPFFRKHWYLVIVDRPANAVAKEEQISSVIIHSFHINAHGGFRWIYILDSLRDIPPLNVVALIKEFLQWEAQTRFALKLDPDRFLSQLLHVSFCC